MTKIKDLDKLLFAIKDLETRITPLRVHLLKNGIDIKKIQQLQEALEENIVELKRNYVVALAQEFKKAKGDLEKAKTRLAFLEMARDTYEMALKDHLRLLQELKAQYEDDTKKLQNNVIQGKFGRKDGRQDGN